MEIDEKNLQKIKKLQELLKMIDESLTRKEFTDAFQKVMDFILQIKAGNEGAITVMKEAHERMMSKMENDNTSSRAELKKQIMNYCEKEMAGIMKSHEKKMSEMDERIDEKMETIKSGKDADEEKIVQDVLAQIKLPEQKEIILDGPKELKNKLESLRGGDRINIDAINGLDEEFKRLKDILSGIPRARAMGRAKVPITRAQNLTSQVDGVVSTFTLDPDTTAVFGVFGTQFPVNFNAGTDWTFAGRTLTLVTAQVGVPQVGQTLWCLTEVLFSP